MTIQGFCEKIWEARAQVLATAAGNANPKRLTQDQTNKILKIISTICVPQEDFPGKVQIQQEIQDLSYIIANNQLGREGDQLGTIITELDQIGKTVFQIFSSKAEGSDVAFALMGQLKEALIKATHPQQADPKQARSELHRVINVILNEFISKPQIFSGVSEFTILPGLEWSTPEKLEELFRLLTEVAGDKSLKETVSVAASCGAAAGVAAAEPLERGFRAAAEKTVKGEEIEKIQAKLADFLAPITFKVLRKMASSSPASSAASEQEQKEQKASAAAAGIQNDRLAIREAEKKALDERRQRFIASPLFQQMSDRTFRDQINSSCDPSQCTFEEADILLAVAYEMGEKDTDRGKTFLRRLARKFDLYTPLKRAAEDTNLAEIERLLSFPNLLKLVSTGYEPTLFQKFSALEKEWLASPDDGPDKASRLLRVFLHPNSVDLNFDRALVLTLLGPNPYHVNVHETWTLEAPSPNVDQEKLRALLLHPRFQEKDRHWLRMLFLSLMDNAQPYLHFETFPRQGFQYGDFPKPSLAVKKIVIRAVAKHTNFSGDFTNHLLSKIYNQRDFEREDGRLLDPNVHLTVKKAALGDKKMREPIAALVKSSETLELQDLLEGFESYQKEVDAIVVPQRKVAEEFSKRPQDDVRIRFRRNATRLLIPQFLAVFSRELALKNVNFDEFLNSELFCYMERLLVIGHMERCFVPSRSLLADRCFNQFMTHPQRMNLFIDYFRAGFKFLLRQEPIDCEKLKRALILPIFNTDWIGKKSFLFSQINQLAIHIDSLEGAENSSSLKQGLVDVLKILTQNLPLNCTGVKQFMCFKPDLKQPREKITINVTVPPAKSIPGRNMRSEFYLLEISHEVASFIKEAILENFNQNQLMSQDLSSLMNEILDDELSQDRTEDGVNNLNRNYAIIFQHPDFRFVTSEFLEMFMVRAAILKFASLIPLVIEQLAARKVATDDAEDDESAATAAVEALAGNTVGGSTVKSRKQPPYHCLFDNNLSNDGIHLIVTSVNFSKIANDVLVAIGESSSTFEARHAQWLLSLEAAGFVSQEQALQIRQRADEVKKKYAGI